jgi:hypothetical protein
MARVVPPAIDALHACHGKRFSYNWYKGSVSRLRSRPAWQARQRAVLTGRMRLQVLALTFLCYMSFHMCRKPPSIVKRWGGCGSPHSALVPLGAGAAYDAPALAHDQCRGGIRAHPPSCRPAPPSRPAAFSRAMAASRRSWRARART